jgi:aromatic ring-opening dioxygenase LigB subunit
MSTVIWALSPHPPLLIPEVGGPSLERVHQTREGMEQMCQAVADSRPERLVLITPHGPVHPRAVPFFVVDRLAGDLGRFGHPEVSIEVEVDRPLTLAIIQAARAREVAILPLDAGEAARRGVPLELDHALMVPLYYLQRAGVRVPTVIMSISWLPEADHVRLGEALREVLRASSQRVAVVASGDLSHRLLDSGPYGFDEMGPVFDRQMLECLKRADAPGILALPEDLVERAGQCGMRPILTMLGSTEPGARGVVHSYEGPFGVGYAVVHFEPPTADVGASGE